MDNVSVDAADLEHLNEKDKTELRQFLQNENQKARMQSTIHALTETCFKKCITSTIRSGKLEKAEESCMSSCAERFFDVSNLTVKHLQNMRQG